MNKEQFDPHIERVSLERIKFHVQSQLRLMDFDAEVDIHEEIVRRATHEMVLRLKKEIAGQRLDKIKYPADWKEALKERWLPKRLLERYPVKYSTIEVMALYPQLALTPDNTPPMFYVKRNPYMWRED